MSTANFNPDEYVKKDRMYYVAVVALIIGFIGGIIYSKYISPTRISDHGSNKFTQFNVPEGNAANIRKNDISRLEKEALANPKNVEIWTQLGNFYFDTNQVEKAISAYKRTLKLKPNNANVWTDLGVMYRRNNQSVEAINAFDSAIEIDPRHETSRINKGIVLLHDLDDKKRAIKAWEGLLKINPSIKSNDGQAIADMVRQLKDELKHE